MLWCYVYSIIYWGKWWKGIPAFTIHTQAQTKAHKGTKAQSTKAQKYKKAKVKMEKAVIAFWQRGAWSVER